VIQEAERLYTEREEQYTPEVVRQVEVQLMLGLIDERWADYLTTLEHLKDDIRWQSLGQRDPLVEFKAEAFSAFQAFQESLKQEIVRYLFHSQIQVQPMTPHPLEGVATHPEAAPAVAAATQDDNAPLESQRPLANGPVGPSITQTSAAAVVASAGAELRAGQAVPVVGRNALCPCGSGKKYKRCHGATG
jgi:preprotein translocase subunit SecA